MSFGGFFKAHAQSLLEKVTGGAKTLPDDHANYEETLNSLSHDLKDLKTEWKAYYDTLAAHVYAATRVQNVMSRFLSKYAVAEEEKFQFLIDAQQFQLDEMNAMVRDGVGVGRVGMR